MKKLFFHPRFTFFHSFSFFSLIFAFVTVLVVKKSDFREEKYAKSNKYQISDKYVNLLILLFCGAFCPLGATSHSLCQLCGRTILQGHRSAAFSGVAQVPIPDSRNILSLWLWLIHSLVNHPLLRAADLSNSSNQSGNFAHCLNYSTQLPNWPNKVPCRNVLLDPHPHIHRPTYKIHTENYDHPNILLLL